MSTNITPILSIIEKEPNLCLVAATDFQDHIQEMLIPTSFEKLTNWMYHSGELPFIQDYFPELSTDEREFLLSGMTQEAWDELFAADDVYRSWIDEYQDDYDKGHLI